MLPLVSRLGANPTNAVPIEFCDRTREGFIMSTFDLEIVAPEGRDHGDLEQAVLSAMNDRYRERGMLGDHDAMEASLGVVAAEAAISLGAGCEFPTPSKVRFWFGPDPSAVEK